MISFLILSTISATTPEPGAMGFMEILPPKFLYSEGMDFPANIICGFLFALIIFLTLSLKPDLKSYQMALLYAVGFYIGIYEVLLGYLFEVNSIIFLLPCFALGAVMSLYEPTTTLIGSLATTYPAYMLIVSILNPQSKVIGLIIMALVGACFYFLLGSTTPIFERASKSIIHTFLACCIFELCYVYNVFTNALTLIPYSFGIAANISRFIIILFLLFFTFVSPAIIFISNFIFGEENSVKKEESV